jgi:hypothetical protein
MVIGFPDRKEMFVLIFSSAANRLEDEACRREAFPPYMFSGTQL